MMASNKEKGVCVKFCFLIGESAVETVLMLQEAFKEEVYVRLKCTGGIYVSKGVKCHVTTSQDLADLQSSEMMKILKKFATKSIQIVVGPLMEFLR